MNLITATTIVLICSNTVVLANECREKFITIAADATPKGPLKMVVTSFLNGKKTMKSNFFQLHVDHWLNEGLSPKGMPSTLAYQHSMYNSFDNGKSWKKVGDLDAEKGRREGLKQLMEDVKTTSNATCGEEVIEGVSYNWVEADYNSLKDEKTKYHNKYWTIAKTNWLAKTSSQIINPNYKTLVIQTIEKAPNLSLPTPK